MKLWQLPKTKQRPATGYQLWHNGKIVAEHTAPSYLNWYKQQHNLTGATIRAIR